MTTALEHAVDCLNGLADAISQMDKEEAQFIGSLICNLAACITADEQNVQWHVETIRHTMQ